MLQANVLADEPGRPRDGEHLPKVQRLTRIGHVENAVGMQRLGPVTQCRQVRGGV